MPPCPSRAVDRRARESVGASERLAARHRAAPPRRAPRRLGPFRARVAGIDRRWQTRVRALWTLDGLDAIDAALVTAALGDATLKFAIRPSASPNGGLAAGTPSSRQWQRSPRHPLVGSAQLAASLGARPRAPVSSVLVTLLEPAGDDPVIVDAAIGRLRGLERRCSPSGERVPRLDATGRVCRDHAHRDGRSWRGHDSVQQVLGWGRIPTSPTGCGARSCAASRSACSARRAGLPARRGANSAVRPRKSAPCPTCPGGRAGPGGVLCVSTAARLAVVSAADRGGAASRRRAGVRPPRRGRDSRATRRRPPEPHHLAGEARAAVVTPLTPEEQPRFTRVARSIATSARVAISPTAGVRIGLRRPWSVRTCARSARYPRSRAVARQGGTDRAHAAGRHDTRRRGDRGGAHLRAPRMGPVAASPVDGGGVRKRAREADASRTRPWRHEELTAMVGEVTSMRSRGFRI